MLLENDNFAELQKLREELFAQQDPNYVPGSIPIAEIAKRHGVSVHTMIAAYQADGRRGIDDLSLMTAEDAEASSRILRKYRDLQDPRLASLRRGGFIPVTEFTFRVKTPLGPLLEACIAVGFSPRLATEDLWLDQHEQRLVQEWLSKPHTQPTATDRVAAKPQPPVSRASQNPSGVVKQDALAPVRRPELDTPQHSIFRKAPSSSPISGLSPTEPAKAVKQAIKNSHALVPPRLLVDREIAKKTIVREIGDIDLRDLNRLLGDREVQPTPKFPVFRTPIGTTSVEISEIQRTMDSFQPASYGHFFHQLRAALRIDARIRKSMSLSEQSQKNWTNPVHAKFINEIFDYKYGIFAYAPIGSRIGDKARKANAQTQPSQTASLRKFRPMYKGLLTDESRRQFILWRVGEGIPDLLVIKWDSLSGWLDGMESGHYVGLRARHIRVVKNLESQDQDIVRLMVAMADNLRAGTRRTTPRPVKEAPRGRKQLVGQRTAQPRTLGYKPENDWLVPITVSGHNVSTGLDDDFFTAHGAKRAHQVRSFYRREPGSPLNSPRTVLVRGHVRSGIRFEDARLLPAVTIRRK